jgi:hypothetical protein
MRLTTNEKLVLGFGAAGLILWWLWPSTASASTGMTVAGGGTTTPSTAGQTSPNAGDQLLVTTQSAGAAGQLIVRNAPGAGTPGIPGTTMVFALAQGATVSATGQTQTAADGSVWWGVTNGTLSGWANSTYLQDQTTQLQGGAAAGTGGSLGSSGFGAGAFGPVRRIS